MLQVQFVKKYLEKGLDSIEANYASLIEGVDQSLGDLMNFLDKRQITDNTVILFMSDNGGLSNTPPRGGIPFKHNAPLSSGKSSAREGGIRVPMIVSWPGHIKIKSTNEALVIIEDFFSSIIEITNAQLKVPQIIDGQSFVESFKDTMPQNDERILIWHYPNDNGNPEGYGFGPYSAIRNEDWKLIYYHIDSSFELFNLKNDIGENYNLFNTNKKIATKLAKKLTNYLIGVNAQMPIHKRDGIQVEWPISVINK